MDRALNVEEPLVLVTLDGYPETWQHRVLLRRVKEARWVTLGVDGGLEVLDLADCDLIPLALGAPIPARAGGDYALWGPSATRSCWATMLRRRGWRRSWAPTAPRLRSPRAVATPRGWRTRAPRSSARRCRPTRCRSPAW